MTLAELIPYCEQQLQALFSYYLKDIPSPDLRAAMQYVLSRKGKRLRPLLTYATGTLFQTAWDILDLPACAIELIHTYSLIHDDLPAMDNADLRRYHPTCHKVYGDGMAILTGDALHTLAMHLLADHPSALNTEQRLQMIGTLSRASGPLGMIGGQALDVTVMSKQMLTDDWLEYTYHLKTGTLFSACIELGQIASDNNDEWTKASLTQFSTCIGLAFQIHDDLLDMGSVSKTGKSQGIDTKSHKITYPMRYGLSHTEQKIQMLYEEALKAIHPFGHRAQLLRECTDLLLFRKITLDTCEE